MRRFIAILSLFALALGVLLWILLLTSISADAMSENYQQILYASVFFTVLLLILTGWQIWRIFGDIRAQKFGSRLKLKLTLMFGLIAIIPGVLIYLVSVQFITHSIESWFDVRVEAALESGLNLGQAAFDYLRGDLAQKAAGMAHDIANRPESGLRAHLAQLREQAAVDSVALFSPAGQLLISSQRDLTLPLPPLPMPSELKQAQALTISLSGMDGLTSLVIIDEQDSNEAEQELRLRVLLPVAARSFFEAPRVLQLAQNVPENLHQNTEAVRLVYSEYQELKLARQGLTRIYALSLTLTLFVVLFVAFALAFFLARRLSAPLSILAEGTQAVTQGDYSQRRIVKGGDELGALTQSFNQMTRQLFEARQENERHRNEMEGARAYLESILANLSAGVLVFDADRVLRTLNEGALSILGEALSDELHVQATTWRHFPLLGKLLETHFTRAGEDDWQGQTEVERLSGEGQIRHLLLRGSRLPIVSGGGFVVVFDDITRLIAAQRSVAWGEVARRLAHEIKNPLTPIQLSAERLQFKLADSLAGKEREILEHATQTIVNQVLAMKRMVDDFRDYSRLPAPELAPLDLNALILEVLALYENSGVRVRSSLADNLPWVRGDANQLRQVIHNLLRNSEDALENVYGAEIFIRTVENGVVLLEIEDNGDGFPAEILPRLFEPYITTKSRGTGLGLPIVKKIIDEHDGEIAIGNKPEGGARIVVRLPQAEQQINS
ncbi:MAG: ATP-binding protein [Betaproteobacteria bacterium]|nr:ATP-binding protein [Betaproteobacteria bacterium]